MSVGYVVAFLCQSSMGRSGKGWVKSPVNNRAFGGAMKPQRLALKAQKSGGFIVATCQLVLYICVTEQMNPPRFVRSGGKGIGSPAAAFFSKPVLSALQV